MTTADILKELRLQQTLAGCSGEHAKNEIYTRLIAMLERLMVVDTNVRVVTAPPATDAENANTFRLERDAVTALLQEALTAIEAFTDPEDNMPADTPEFRDLKALMLRLRAAPK